MRVGAVLIFIYFITGCAKSHMEGGRSPPKVLRIPIYQDIAGLDPLDAQNILAANIIRHIYDCLLDYDPENLNLSPELAQSYEVSGTGKTYIFHLRDDVYFHNDPCFKGGIGRKLTSYDVKFSLERNISRCSKFKNIVREILVPDSFTVVIKLKKRANDFLYCLASNIGFIVPKEAIDYYGASFTYHPVGTGPFRAAIVDLPYRIVLVKNDRYWKTYKGKKLPLVDVIDFIFITTPHLEAAFRRGELDMCPVSLPAPKRTASMRTFEMTKFNTLGIAFNMNRKNPYTANELVRRALFNSLPDDYGEDEPAHSFLPPGMGNPGIYLKRNNMKLAEELLRRAGFPHGAGLPPLDVFLPAGDEHTYGKILKKSFGRLGINVRIHPVPRNIYWENIREGKYYCFRMGWIAENPEPRLFYGAFYSGSSENLTNFKDEEYDSLYLMSFEADSASVGKLMKRMEEILLEKMPFIYMKHEKFRVTVQENVIGWEYSANPLNRWFLELVDKK